jgi:hypothetical protein
MVQSVTAPGATPTTVKSIPAMRTLRPSTERDQRVGRAEDRDVRARAQRDGDDRDRADAGVPGEHAPTVAEILKDGIDEHGPPSIGELVSWRVGELRTQFSNSPILEFTNSPIHQFLMLPWIVDGLGIGVKTRRGSMPAERVE